MSDERPRPPVERPVSAASVPSLERNEGGQVISCGICLEQVPGARACACSGTEPHHICSACFVKYARAEFEPGGAFEGRRQTAHPLDAHAMTSEPGQLPCYLFVTGQCDCNSIPTTTIARVLSSDADSLRLHDLAKRRIFAAEEETARREAELRAQEEADQRAPVDQLRAEVTEVLSRGGYVACPRCGVHGQKNDACMHMACPCGASYCYCCGRRREGRWRGGRCSDANGRCDIFSPYLENNAGWGAFALRGESAGLGALHEFHRKRMAYFLRQLKETHPAHLWADLRRIYPGMLEDVPTSGRHIGWDEIDQALPPLFGSTRLGQLQWANRGRDARTEAQQQARAHSYKLGDFTRQAIAKGKEAAGRDQNDHYIVGDFTRGIISKGKEKNGRDEHERYRFGDFTRGLLG